MSLRSVAAIIGVTEQTVIHWRNNGEKILAQIENREINEDNLEDNSFDMLCYNFYKRTREAKSKLIADLTEKYTVLAENTEVDHVKEKIISKSLISLDREHWSDNPKVQINQQFNAIVESDRILNESTIAEKIAEAVHRRLPGNTGDTDRAELAKQIRRDIEDNEAEFTDI